MTEETGFIRPCRDCGEPSDPAMTMDFTDVEPGAFLHWCTACGEQAHTMNAIFDRGSGRSWNGRSRKPKAETGLVDSVTITLNAYQAANLREAIRAIGYPHDENVPRSPLCTLNTGDWIGEVAIMLGSFGKERTPNRTAEDMAASARAWSDR